MAKKDKYRKTKAEDFFDYKEGKLSSQDENLFERQLERDEFDMEALDGLSMLSREEFSSDLQMLETKIRRRIRRNRRIAWYSAAATVASIAVVTTVFLNIDTAKLNQPDTLPEMKEEVQESPVIMDHAAISEDESKVEPGSKKAGKGEAGGKGEKNQSDAIATSEEIDSPPSEQAMQISPDKKMEIQQGNQTEILIVEDDEAMGEAELDEIEAQNFARSQNQDTDQPRYERKEAEGISEAEIQQETEQEEPSANQSMAILSTKDEISDSGKGKRAEDMQKEAAAADYRAKRSAAPVKTVSIYEEEKFRLEQPETSDAAYVLQGQVSGVVRSAEDFKPIPGASVVVKGSTIGTVTDINGRFTFDSGLNEGNTLLASFVGMEMQEIHADLQQPMEIALLPSSMNLDEVVVLGYGNLNTEEPVGNVVEVDINTGIEGNYEYAVPAPGFDAYKEYINATLVYPPDIKDVEKAVVVLRFTITKTGIPTNFKVIKTPSPVFSDEAIRVIREGALWIPASRDDIAVEETLRMRIVFNEDHAR